MPRSMEKLTPEEKAKLDPTKPPPAGMEPFIPEAEIQIVYHGGTWGNLFCWLLDRFSPECKFKDKDNPWDEHDRVHFDWDFQSNKFSSAHQQQVREWFRRKLLANSKKIVLNFPEEDLVFAVRCVTLRTFNLNNLKNQSVNHGDPFDGLDEERLKMFNSTNPWEKREMIIKEMYKINFHDAENHEYWKTMREFCNNKNHYQVPLECLWQKDMLISELEKISKHFNLNLTIEEKVIDIAVDKIKNNSLVKTRMRVHVVLNAILDKNNIDCSDLDIIEQAWIETMLEKQYDNIIFPYGNNWFKNTKQIIDFLETYPTYLKHMNPRLPWYNNIKNPFYLTGQIDESK